MWSRTIKGTPLAVFSETLLRRWCSHNSMEADLVVIGSGPSGRSAAVRGAQLGMKTVCVEKGAALGGSTFHLACRSLLTVCRHYELAKEFRTFGISIAGLRLNTSQMFRLKDQEIESFSRDVSLQLEADNVTLVRGHGTISGIRQVTVLKDDGSQETIRTQNIVIATGSREAARPEFEIDEEKIVSSNGALSLKAMPNKIVVVGAGIAGLQLSSIWSRLAEKVVVIDSSNNVGGSMGLDATLANTLAKTFDRKTVQFKLGFRVTKIMKTDRQVTVIADSVSKPDSRIKILCDVVFVCVGRVPFTDGLGLDTIHIPRDSSGGIIVDSRFQTASPNIYAVGDCVAGRTQPSKADLQGAACVEGMVGGSVRIGDNTAPSVIYTQPEVAWIEKSATDDKGVKTQRLHFPANVISPGDSVDTIAEIFFDKAKDPGMRVYITSPDAGQLIRFVAFGLALGIPLNSMARKICNLMATKTHFVRQVTEKRHQCPRCDAQFQKSSDLKRHLTAVHLKKRPFVCDICNEAFARKETLTIHQLTMHNKNPQYVCPYCRLKLFDKALLKTHIEIHHDGIKPYACPICHLRLASTTSLKRHMLTHTGEKPFRCRYCDKAFRQFNSLREHESIHTEEKLYSCSQCNKSFRTSGQLRVHVQLKHSLARKHVCDICTKSFKTTYTLRQHFVRCLAKQDKAKQEAALDETRTTQ